MNSKKTASPGKPKSCDSLSWIELYKLIADQYQKGVDGDKDSAREALRLLEQARIQAPDNNLVLAYYGSTLCLLGRDLTDSIERSANVIRGLKFLDEAVAHEPDNFEIRVIRGNVCVNLPEMYFHRSDSAIEDCKFVISCYEKYPDSIPADLYFQFMYNLSIAYQNLGDEPASESILKKLILESQDPKYKNLLAPKGTANGCQNTDSFYMLLQPFPILLEEGARLHQAALSGGKMEVKKAADFFTKAMVLHPNNPLLKTYHADCMSLQGRTATNTGEMFASAIKATKVMDALVNGEPDNIKIRYIRANHSMRLPEVFFARTATAITDLEYMAAKLRQDPGLFGADQTEEILFNLGICYFRLGLDNEGEVVWQNLYNECSEQTREKISVHRRNRVPLNLNPNLSLAANPAEYFAEAKRLHSLGVSGNQAAARKAFDLWEKAYSANPADPVAQGFYGSSLALIGRDSSETGAMYGNAIKGLKHLSEALGRDPENWELHLLRAYLSYSLPEVFFHTTQQAIDDFQYLKNAYEQKSNLFAWELYDQILIDLQKARRKIE
jgi:hypothetical protein